MVKVYLELGWAILFTFLLGSSINSYAAKGELVDIFLSIACFILIFASYRQSVISYKNYKRERKVNKNNEKLSN